MDTRQYVLNELSNELLKKALNSARGKSEHYGAFLDYVNSMLSKGKRVELSPNQLEMIKSSAIKKNKQAGHIAGILKRRGIIV